MRYTKTALILIVIFLASCSSSKKVKDHIVDCSLIETPSKDVNLAQLEEDLLLIRSQIKKNSSQQQALISKQVESNANLQGCPIDSRGFKVMSCVNFHAKLLKKISIAR
ncbi:hypothetical protein [Catenovulum maritimum]|uniref:Lipoprotein n=1 Tax=Catenovulum maritimum TaxID=1513271 RepID=A0A0J8GZI1_9ALTE|nr:hypothetical protein [Catenovulum maritimum]KMT66644.1 hypothetical protein XM47_00460 [Catenovulum maritimum]